MRPFLTPLTSSDAQFLWILLEPATLHTAWSHIPCGRTRFWELCFLCSSLHFFSLSRQTLIIHCLRESLSQQKQKCQILWALKLISENIWKNTWSSCTSLYESLIKPWSLSCLYLGEPVFTWVNTVTYLSCVGGLCRRSHCWSGKTTASRSSNSPAGSTHMWASGLLSLFSKSLQLDSYPCKCPESLEDPGCTLNT